MGGIAEVSTNPSHRKVGLASQLLQMAIAFMQKHKVCISSLHTGSAAPLYAKHGWVASPIALAAIAIPKKPVTQQQAVVSSSSSNSQEFSVQYWRDASQFETSVLKQFASIYNYFNIHNQFNGWLGREDFKYWEQWVTCESTINNNEAHVAVMNITNEVLGYLFIRRHATNEGSIVLEFKDFAACESQVLKDGGLSLFLSLCIDAAKARASEIEMASTSQVKITRVPMALLQAFTNASSSSSSQYTIVEESKDEIMYKMITPSQCDPALKVSDNADEATAQIVSYLNETNKKHLFYKTDSF